MFKIYIPTILDNANTMCDDNIDDYTLYTYLNKGIIDININCSLNLPRVPRKDVVDKEKEYVVSENANVNEIVSNILTAYIAFCIKRADGYQNEENPFYVEYISLRNNFNAYFKIQIKEEYRVKQEDNMEFFKAKKPTSPFKVKAKLF